MKTFRQYFVPLLLTALTAFVLGIPRAGQGCAAAPPPGARVTIAGEEAIIVWNPETQTEDFIRQASFESHAARRPPLDNYRL